MTPREYFQSKSKPEVEAVCKKAGTTYANFNQIANFNSAVGKKLAERLAKASDGEMTEIEILYPERFNDEHAA